MATEQFAQGNFTTTIMRLSNATGMNCSYWSFLQKSLSGSVGRSMQESGVIAFFALARMFLK